MRVVMNLAVMGFVEEPECLNPFRTMPAIAKEKFKLKFRPET